jgi:hypothetical protein
MNWDIARPGTWQMEKLMWLNPFSLLNSTTREENKKHAGQCPA